MTEETKHTAGPWMLGERDGDFIAIDAPTHTGLATVVWQMEDDRLCGDNSPRQEANARLIAAAPNLLAALKDARTQLEQYEMLLNGESYNSPSINAAIAKAEGFPQ